MIKLQYFGDFMKKTFFIFLIFIQFSFLFATKAKYSAENYNFNVVYNETITPGDAIFVKLSVTNVKNHKKNKNETEKKATLQLLNEKKVITSSPFYEIYKNKKQNFCQMLCGLPISQWLSDGNYSLKLIFADSDEDIKEFILPSNFKMRNFNEEVLELNEKNTAIKTDNSPERIAQIDKLNSILETYVQSDIYSLKPFILPISSQNYTAYFGDKRVYKYTNGKSSVNSHYGNDYGVPTGTEVCACANGKVVLAENRISTGYSVVIEHLPGLYSLYYHLSELCVEEGDMVKQSDLIGKSGATGLATGPHLHWEVRLNSMPVRPEFFMQNFTFSTEK